MSHHTDIYIHYTHPHTLHKNQGNYQFSTFTNLIFYYIYSTYTSETILCSIRIQTQKNRDFKPPSYPNHARIMVPYLKNSLVSIYQIGRNKHAINMQIIRYIF